MGYDSMLYRVNHIDLVKHMNEIMVNQVVNNQWRFKVIETKFKRAN